jgi:hypothetical protein
MKLKSKSSSVELASMDDIRKAAEAEEEEADEAKPLVPAEKAGSDGPALHLKIEGRLPPSLLHVALNAKACLDMQACRPRCRCCNRAGGSKQRAPGPTCEPPESAAQVATGDAPVV